MSEIAIRVFELGKQYRIGGTREPYKTFRNALIGAAMAPVRGVRSLVRRDTQDTTTFWALQDLNFEIGHGEVVGVIGRNGAGKSTLLKILSRITEPTVGGADVYGRVGSLLEVGTGFHPELTGRENVYLNGAIIGMRRGEIENKFDEIVAFAEIEKFIDTPVKHYSSGMYLRLAFAVAAHLEPEILLVDEVLAVGDAAFQKKCLGKMGEVAKQGRTVFFVSHNLQAIANLTRRSLVLEAGKLAYDGDTSFALNRYRTAMDPLQNGEYLDQNKATGVVRAKVTTSEPGQIHGYGKPLEFEFDIRFKSKPIAGSFSFQIVDEEMKPITYLWLFHSDRAWAREGQVTLRCVIPKPRLYMGRYSLVTYLDDRGSNDLFETIKGICTFEVSMDEIPREYVWRPGASTYLEDGDWDVR